MIPKVDTDHDFDGSAVVLLSGGPDSMSMAEIANQRHDDVYALYAHFNQNANDAEVRAAQRVADHYDMPLRVVELGDMYPDLLEWGEDIDGFLEEDRLDDPDLYYMSFRFSQIILQGGMLADMTNSRYIYWGVHYESRGVPDHNPEVGIHLTNAFEASTLDRNFDMVCPFVGHTRPEVLEMADEAGAPWQKTYSCLRESEDLTHCGECKSCKSRQQKLGEAGIEDPTEYKH